VRKAVSYQLQMRYHPVGKIVNAHVKGYRLLTSLLKERPKEEAWGFANGEVFILSSSCLPQGKG
jgi:hypothetical protein